MFALFITLSFWYSLYFSPSIECLLLIGNQNITKDYYQEGVLLSNAGDWEAALKVWWAGRNEIECDGKTDPRLAIAFIELVTTKQAKRYYRTASEMYLWGFSRDLATTKYYEFIAKEAERIIPLLAEKTAKEWRRLIKSRDPAINHQIRLFWLEKDPTPTTVVNERLLEHWERIAYSRKHFTRNRHSVYDCDDRGTIYVKYGEPDLKKSGQFGASSAGEMELMRWVESPVARMTIRLNNPAPEYEVWKYVSLGSKEPSIFLFSCTEGLGSFGLQAGIEFTMQQRDYLLQIMYYAELMSFDRFFEQRYHQLETLWDRASIQGRNIPNTKHMRGIFLNNKTIDKTDPTYKYAVAEKSHFDDLTSPIDVITYPVRTLDNRNQPRLTVLAFSYPQFKVKTIKKTASKEGGYEIPGHVFKHMLIIRDKMLQEIDRKFETVPAGLDNVSVFSLNHLQNYVHFTLAAEASSFEESTSKEDKKAFEKPNKILALGKTFFEPAPPLLSHPDSLEMSDLVLGVGVPLNYDAANLPFPLVPARRVTKQEPLKVYLEVYHLEPDQNGTARFNIDFSAVKLDKQGRVKKKEGEITLTFQFESQHPTSKEPFSIDIAKLKSGNYLLTAKVEDLISKQTKARSVKFEVLE